jgi:hypothetical protein
MVDGSPAPEPEIHDVNDFVFDAQGRIAFLRGSLGHSLALVVVDQQGKVINAVPRVRECQGPRWIARSHLRRARQVSPDSRRPE